MEMTPPPPVVPRPYRRSTSDRIFGGVCGGLGRYWNVDPVILRVAFGVSLLFGGFGLFVYLALWLLVPDDLAPGNARIRDSWGLRILGALAAFVAAGIGLALLFGESNGGVLIGALLAGVIVWIVMSQKASRPAVETAPPEVGYAYGGTGGYETTAYPTPMPPAPPRERSYLGLIALCASIAAAGVAMLITNNPTAIMASALLALGAALLVGGFRGRARWLLILAVPLLLLLAPVSQVQRADTPLFTATTFQPTANDTAYSATSGWVTVDFSQWQGLPDGDEVRVELAAGQVVLQAPKNWNMKVIDQPAGILTVNDPSDRPGIKTTTDRNGHSTLIPAATARAEGNITVYVTVPAGSVQIDTGAPAAGTIEPSPLPKASKTSKEKAA